MSFLELTGFPVISENADSLKSVVEATGHVTERLDTDRNGKTVTVVFADASAALDVVAQLDGLFYDADHTLVARVVQRPVPDAQRAGGGGAHGEQLTKSGACHDGYGGGGGFPGRGRSRSRSRRRSRSPRHKGNYQRDWGNEDNLNFQVELSNLPEAYTHESLVELHDYLELRPGTFESTRFDDRRGIAICRYADESSARAAAEALHGQEVVEVGGGVQLLEARVRASSGPAKVYPSVYISDVPLDFTEDALREMHAKEGLDTRGLVGAKVLNSKNPASGTTCCIARYADQKGAEAAISHLRGKPVVTASGVVKFLGMRMAKPAGWMVKTGRDHQQQQLYKDSRANQKKSKPFRHRLDRFSDQFCLDRPTVVWLSRMPQDVQSMIYEEFDARASDPSLKDREELAVQLRLFAESVHPESAGEAPKLGPAPWEELDPGNPITGFAQRWKLSKGDIKWFSALSRDVQWRAMQYFNPDGVGRDLNQNTGAMLRSFVQDGGNLGDKGRDNRKDTGWEKGLDKGGWNKGGYDKGGREKGSWTKGPYDKGNSGKGAWAKGFGKEPWDNGKGPCGGPGGHEPQNVPPPPPGDPWEFGPTVASVPPPPSAVSRRTPLPPPALPPPPRWGAPQAGRAPLPPPSAPLRKETLPPGDFEAADDDYPEPPTYPPPHTFDAPPGWQVPGMRPGPPTDACEGAAVEDWGNGLEDAKDEYAEEHQVEQDWSDGYDAAGEDQATWPGDQWPEVD